MRAIGQLHYLAIQSTGLILIASAGTSYCAADEQADNLCPKAKTLYLSGKFKQAAREYCNCIKENPSGTEIYRARGLVYMASGDFRKAQHDFETAGEPPGVVEEAQSTSSTVIPECVEAMGCEMRASELLATGNATEALEQYRKAISIRPNFPECWDNLGLALAKNGQASEGSSYIVKALSWRPKKAETWFHLGEILGNQRSYKDSRDAFTIALSLAPTEDYRKKVREAIDKVDNRIDMQNNGFR